MDNTVIAVRTNGQQHVERCPDSKTAIRLIQGLAELGKGESKFSRFIVVTTTRSLGEYSAVVLYNGKGEHVLDITLK